MKLKEVASEEGIQDAKDHARVKREQRLDDIRELLKIPAGRRFFKQFFDDGMVFRTTFTGNSQTFFNEGHRNLALKYLHDVAEASPESISSLIVNNKTESLDNG
jgi:hypothetical protein